MTRAVNPVLHAGLTGLAAYLERELRQRVPRPDVFPQTFWRRVSRALELCARAWVETKLQRDQAGGAEDRAWRTFEVEVETQVSALGLLPHTETEAVRLALLICRAGLEALTPGAAVYAEEHKHGGSYDAH